MANEDDRKRLQRLAVLAELAAQKSAAELQTRQSVRTRLDDQLTALDQPPAISAQDQVTFTSSGAAERWYIWQARERQRLGILAARARLAAEAARRTYARDEARRRVLEKLCKPD